MWAKEDVVGGNGTPTVKPPKSETPTISRPSPKRNGSKHLSDAVVHSEDEDEPTPKSTPPQDDSDESRFSDSEEDR